MEQWRRNQYPVSIRVLKFPGENSLCTANEELSQPPARSQQKAHLVQKWNQFCLPLNIHNTEIHTGLVPKTPFRNDEEEKSLRKVCCISSWSKHVKYSRWTLLWQLLFFSLLTGKGFQTEQLVQLNFLNNKEHQILVLGGPFLNAPAYVYWLQKVLAWPCLILATKVEW